MPLLHSLFMCVILFCYHVWNKERKKIKMDIEYNVGSVVAYDKKYT